VHPKKKLDIPADTYSIKVDYVSNNIADLDLGQIKFSSKTDTLFKIDNLGRLKINAFNKNGEETEYFMQVYDLDGNFLYQSEGMNGYFDLPADIYNLKFSVAGEDVEKNDITVVVGKIKEVIVDLSKEEEHLVPPGWVIGTLYNSNDGSCGLQGEYIIFNNTTGLYANYTNTFKNLKTGEVNPFIVVAPGEKLEVAVPVTTSWIRAHRSKSADIDPGNLGERINFYTVRNLRKGWWYTAGCIDGTYPNTRCDNGNGQGPSNQFSSCRPTYQEEH